jgi:hypothetical protein
VAQAVQHLLCKYKALSSNSSPIKKKKKRNCPALHLQPYFNNQMADCRVLLCKNNLKLP